MTRLQFATDVSPVGELMRDDSARASALSYATNVHGFAEMRSSVPMALPEAFNRYDRSGLPHQRLNDGPAVVYEGRLEDLAITGDGISSTALGYSRALSDIPYTALWSTTDTARWRIYTNAEWTPIEETLYIFDQQDRLSVSLSKGATYQSGNDAGGVIFQIPNLSSRNVVGISFRYASTLPTNWSFEMRISDDPQQNGSSVLFTDTPGTNIGSKFLTFTGKPVLTIYVFNSSGAPFTEVAETGAHRLIISNVRVVTSTANAVNTTTTAVIAAGINVSIPVVTTARMYVGQIVRLGTVASLGDLVVVKSIPDGTHFVADPTAALVSGGNVQAHVIYADEVVRDLVSVVNATNPNQLSSSTALIQSPSLDLFDETYQDQYGADILTRLITLGDNQTTPRQWEWAVWENRILTYQPRGATARTWYIDLAALDLERTLNALFDSVYGIYQDSANRTLRTAAVSDATSIARAGVTRRTFLQVDSTSATQVGVQVAAKLSDEKDPTPRAKLTTDAIFDLNGARWPATVVRANDIIVIRNLPPTLGTTVDRVRSFRIVRTDLNVITGMLTIEPESPLPTLTALLARAAAPAWVTTPWWVQVAQK